MVNDDHTFRKATTKEIILVSEYLKQHLLPSGNKDADGKTIYRFADGWSDERIANEVAHKFPTNTVLRIRREIYGNIIGAVKDKPTLTTEQRLHCLEAKVDLLFTRLGINPLIENK